MINGLYTAASGMNAELARQEAVANNLANVNTTGFKKDQAVFTAFPNMLVNRINDRMELRAPAVNPYANGAAEPLGVVGHGVQAANMITNFSDGTYTRTDGKFDLALEGTELFTVQLEDGSQAYTRAGNLQLNSEGNLVTPAGNIVLSRKGGPVRISGTDVVIDPTGRVVVDGQESDQLLLTHFSPVNDLEKRGESLYVSANQAGLSQEPGDMKGRVMQGYLENPNVSVIREMVDMISVMRAYEANQKVLGIQDATLDKAVNEVGKV